MANLTAAKAAEILFENFIDTHEEQSQLLSIVDTFKAEGGTLQNADDVIWRGVQQNAPVIDGWDMTGLEQDIIQESYPAFLGTPKNDIVKLRIDKVRDASFWMERGKESGRKQVSEQNRQIGALIKDTGSLFYRTNTTSGFNFVANAQTVMNERQAMADQRKFILNDRDNLAYSTELSGRQTLQGRPDKTWSSGQLGQNIAEFDVYTGSYLGTLAGGADPATTVTANVSLKPEGGSVSANKQVVTNVDYREGVIPVTASASYNVGDAVTFSNAGVPVQSVGLQDKNPTGQAMTFRIVEKISGTSVRVWPKPIAADDPALSLTEQAYANINTRILSGATMNRQNVDALARPSIFFDKQSIEVFQGDIPAQMFAEFGGQKVIPHTMKNGQKYYLLYDANSTTMNVQFRLFTWYSVINKNPSANGIAVRY